MPTPKHETGASAAKLPVMQATKSMGSVYRSSASFNAVPFKQWHEACDRLGAALLRHETRIVVSGPPGTGKTLLLDRVSSILLAAGWTVLRRQDDPIPRTVRDGSGSVALLIDQADKISGEALRHLLATTSAPVVLASSNVLQFRVAGAMNITLSLLLRESAEEYVYYWLALTGRAPGTLEADAMRRAVEISGGVPMLASTLLDTATRLAGGIDRKVTLMHIEHAAALRLCFISEERDGDLAGRRRQPPNLRPSIPKRRPSRVESEFPPHQADTAPLNSRDGADLSRFLEQRLESDNAAPHPKSYVGGALFEDFLVRSSPKRTSHTLPIVTALSILLAITCVAARGFPAECELAFSAVQNTAAKLQSALNRSGK